MKTLVAVLVLFSAGAQAADFTSVKACVKWSKEIAQAELTGAGLFASVARVEGKGPFPACDVVVEADSFGVGWLMRAWMKEGVYSSCGKRLGDFKFHYKGDLWQEKAVTGLHQFLTKNPEALTAAKECPALPAMSPVEVSTAPAAAP